jgi:carnitine O-acetyltransferase
LFLVLRCVHSRHPYSRPDLDHVSPNNWLDDTLWLTLAYHTWRAPLIVNSNWWLEFKEDPGDVPPPTHGNPPKHVVPNGYPAADLPRDSQKGGQEWIEAHQEAGKPVLYDEVTTKEWITPWQIRKAAWLARRFGEYRLMLQKWVSA